MPMSGWRVSCTGVPIRLALRFDQGQGQTGDEHSRPEPPAADFPEVSMQAFPSLVLVILIAAALCGSPASSSTWNGTLAGYAGAHRGPPRQVTLEL